MDNFIAGKSCVGKDLRPRYTCWSHKTVKSIITARKRSSRRIYRQYLKTGNVNDFNRSQGMITRLLFD